jgi:hypothetical protein
VIEPYLGVTQIDNDLARIGYEDLLLDTSTIQNITSSTVWPKARHYFDGSKDVILQLDQEVGKFGAALNNIPTDRCTVTTPA